MKQRTIPLLLLCLMLSSCSQIAPENPYRLIRQSSINYVPEEAEPWVYTYTYNDQGWISESQDNLGHVTVHTYDEYGNILKTEFSSEEEGIYSTIEYALTLDSQHRPIRSESRENGELRGIEETTYDRHGNPTQINIQRYLDGDEILSSWMEIAYDRQGNVIREYVRWSSGSEETVTYQYEDGRCIYQSSCDADGNMLSYTEYSYDETGLVQTKLHHTLAQEYTQKTITTYDEYGNILTDESYLGAGHPLGGEEETLARRNEFTYERILQ